MNQTPSKLIQVLSAVLLSTLTLATTGCEEPVETPTKLPMGMNGTLNTPFITPALTNPKYDSRKDCKLSDDEPVIGVVVKEKPIAFSCKALSGMKTHVVTDKLDGQDFAVTYCDQTDCARVLKPKSDKDPMDVKTGGFMSGSMHLMVAGKMYSHLDKSIPLDDIEFQRTTLGEWMKQHPESTVYWNPNP